MFGGKTNGPKQVRFLMVFWMPEVGRFVSTIAFKKATAMKPGRRFPAKFKRMRSFQFNVFPVENGYRLRAKYGEEEYVWPDIYKTLVHAGEEILKALTTASESRGEN
jgi:hypothetical protein